MDFYRRLVPGMPESANFWKRATEWKLLKTLCFLLCVESTIFDDCHWHVQQNVDLLHQRSDQWRRLCYICWGPNQLLTFHWTSPTTGSECSLQRFQSSSRICVNVRWSHAVSVWFFSWKAKEEPFLFQVTTLSCKHGRRNKEALTCPHRKRIWGSANYLFIMLMKVVSHLEENAYEKLKEGQLDIL